MTNNMTREQAIEFCGLAAVEAVEATNCDFTGRLMTWGKCHTREVVERHANRAFVWVGTCSDVAGEKQRDMYEEIA